MPSLTATITKNPRSQYWQAEFYVWHADSRKWVRTMKSTKATDENRAASIADG